MTTSGFTSLTRSKYASRSSRSLGYLLHSTSSISIWLGLSYKMYFFIVPGSIYLWAITDIMNTLSWAHDESGIASSLEEYTSISIHSTKGFGIWVLLIGAIFSQLEKYSLSIFVIFIGSGTFSQSHSIHPVLLVS